MEGHGTYFTNGEPSALLKFANDVGGYSATAIKSLAIGPKDG